MLPVSGMIVAFHTGQELHILRSTIEALSTIPLSDRTLYSTFTISFCDGGASGMVSNLKMDQEMAFRTTSNSSKREDYTLLLAMRTDPDED
jgi:hypothetical protein